MKEDNKQGDENPFIDRPLDKEAIGDEKKTRQKEAQAPPSVSPIVYGWLDKDKLAMLSGFGFFLTAVIFYFLVVTRGDLALYGYTAWGMALGGLIPFFYMLSDLSIKPARITERVAHFVSGLFLGILVIEVIATLFAFKDDFGRTGSVMLLTFMTLVFTATTLYSMLWIE